MQIGIVSNVFHRLNIPLSQTLKYIRQCGFDAIDDQSLINVTANLYQLSDAEFEKAVSAHRKRVSDAGLSVAQVHGPWRFPPQDGDPLARAEWLRFCKRAIRGCALLGSPYMILHPLMPYGEADEDLEVVKQLNLDFFGELSVCGEQHGVVVCLENMPFGGQLLARPAPTLNFVKEINSPYLRVCLDTGHSAVLGISPADAVRLIGKEYLATLHVHDNDGERDCHWCPGEGVIDWSDFSATLHEIGFKGVLSLECSIPKEVDASGAEEKLAHFAAVANRLAGNT